MIETMILGFLAEEDLHGYELRRRMVQLLGFSRPISDGTIYPAINRLIKQGLVIEEKDKAIAGRARRRLHLTSLGRERLVETLRTANGYFITDPARWFVILGFLSQVPDDNDRRAVLQRRLDYISNPIGFFSDQEVPLHRHDVTDKYREGIYIFARGANQAEKAWLEEMLNGQTTQV
ncbi:PadR family transcriptional regulator [Alloscardovia omnicolens]|uniref:PadR family transcriptional regulator n=1 Tax=Alloscardovia omnicolens TaxID=419015 RepID=UPI003A61FFE1